MDLLAAEEHERAAPRSSSSTKPTSSTPTSSKNYGC
jgi:hypothetical protein